MTRQTKRRSSFCTRTWLRYLLSALVATAGAGLCRAQTQLQGAGATFPDPIYQRWGDEYHKLHPDVQITYQGIGSPGGVQEMIERKADFAGSDIPLTSDQLAAIKAPIVQIPAVAGGIVVNYNLRGLIAPGAELRLTGPVLADIYLGKITRWNDAAIQAINPTVNLPDIPIIPLYRTDGSGATLIFSSYLASQSAEFREKIGASKQPRWKAGQAALGGTGPAGLVQQTTGGISYIELAYATPFHLP